MGGTFANRCCRIDRWPKLRNPVFEKLIELGYGSNEAAILAAERHKNSSLYPYVMSYTSDRYWPIHGNGETDSISDLLADFMVKKSIPFSSSDPYLYLKHLTRTSFYKSTDKNTEVFPHLKRSVLTMSDISKNSKAELKLLKTGGRILNLSLPAKFNSKKIFDPQIDVILDPSIIVARQKKLREMRERATSGK